MMNSDGGDPLRILLVDDDAEDAFLTRELLADDPSFRCTVTVAGTADEAVRLLVRNAFDACLLDYRLGAETGLFVLNSARALGCVTPCILLTGHGGAETDALALQAGAVEYLRKGHFDGQSLTRTLRYAIRNAEANQSLRTSERRFRSVIEAASDAIIVIADDGTIESWNPSALDVFGYPANQFGARTFFSLFALTEEFRSVGVLSDWLKENAVCSTGKSFEILSAAGPRGSFHCELTLSSWQSDDGAHWAAMVRDATSRKALEHELVHQAFHDSLTGLANRSLFRDRVGHAMVRLARNPGFIGVLFCDLDDFKRINDTLGHSAGDELLVNVAQRLESCVRSNDTAARLGGDEFAVLVEDAADPKVAVQVAERILASLTKPFRLEGREISISVSIGIDLAVSSHMTADEVLRNADMAMYSAKRSGKNRYSMFENSMHSTLVNRLHMEADLRHAVANGEITVHYQPILRLPDMKLRGFEALARWIHPTHGSVPPSDFIPLAEDLGLIDDIGRQVLRSACRDLRAWQREFSLPDLVVSVNLSSHQLAHDGLDKIVEFELSSADLSPGSLVLEITESVIVEDPQAAATRLTLIADLGVKIAIDDFGTGYSSLSYLRELPIHIVKVDRSFIRHLGDSERGTAIVDAIVTMSHSLGMETVAEGIETEMQADHVTRSGCNYAQGFLFARPLCASDTRTYLGSFVDAMARQPSVI